MILGAVRVSAPPPEVDTDTLAEESLIWVVADSVTLAVDSAEASVVSSK